MNTRTLNLHDERDADVFRALASEVRVRILDFLGRAPMNINELGQALGLSAPTVTHHIHSLEQAGLVYTEYAQGTQGTQKICSARYTSLALTLEEALPLKEEVEEIELPVGLYTTVDPGGTCGLANLERIIGFYDDPQSFLLPDRPTAHIIWMAEGSVEYVFPNRLPTSVGIDRLELSMELCSEAPECDDDYPSDITVWINDVEIGTWTSPGDMGDRRGRMFPSWWPFRITQYGILTHWTVSHGGSYLNGERVSDVTLDEAQISPRRPVWLRIGVKPDAQNLGGFNLLGRGIGDYDQGIVLRLFYANSQNGPGSESGAA